MERLKNFSIIIFVCILFTMLCGCYEISGRMKNTDGTVCAECDMRAYDLYDPDNTYVDFQTDENGYFSFDVTANNSNPQCGFIEFQNTNGTAEVDYHVSVVCATRDINVGNVGFNVEFDFVALLGQEDGSPACGTWLPCQVDVYVDDVLEQTVYVTSVTMWGIDMSILALEDLDVLDKKIKIVPHPNIWAAAENYRFEPPFFELETVSTLDAPSPKNFAIDMDRDTETFNGFVLTNESVVTINNTGRGGFGIVQWRESGTSTWSAPLEVGDSFTTTVGSVLDFKATVEPGTGSLFMNFDGLTGVPTFSLRNEILTDVVIVDAEIDLDVRFSIPHYSALSNYVDGGNFEVDEADGDNHYWPNMLPSYCSRSSSPVDGWGENVDTMNSPLGSQITATVYPMLNYKMRVKQYGGATSAWCTDYTNGCSTVFTIVDPDVSSYSSGPHMSSPYNNYEVKWRIPSGDSVPGGPCAYYGEFGTEGDHYLRDSYGPLSSNDISDASPRGSTWMPNANYLLVESVYIEPDPVYFTLTMIASAGGTVSPSSGNYLEGSNVTITATPNLGYEFTGWSGGTTGTTNPKTITINSDTSITANFQEIPGACADIAYDPFSAYGVLNPPWQLDLKSDGSALQSNGNLNINHTGVSSWTYGTPVSIAFFDLNSGDFIVETSVDSRGALGTDAAGIYLGAGDGVNYILLGAHRTTAGLYQLTMHKFPGPSHGNYGTDVTVFPVTITVSKAADSDTVVVTMGSTTLTPILDFTPTEVGLFAHGTDNRFNYITVDCE